MFQHIFDKDNINTNSNANNESNVSVSKFVPPLNLVILNSQSITNKKGILGAMIGEQMPDVVTISETWLSPDISSSEVFPKGYRIFRKDRPDGYGGVLLACCDTFTCSKIHIDS